MCKARGGAIAARYTTILLPKISSVSSIPHMLDLEMQHIYLRSIGRRVYCGSRRTTRRQM